MGWLGVFGVHLLFFPTMRPQGGTLSHSELARLAGIVNSNGRICEHVLSEAFSLVV